jgi:hypothetical protein
MEGDTDRALWQKHIVNSGLSRSKLKVLMHKKKILKKRLKQLKLSSSSEKDVHDLESKLGSIDEKIKGEK